MSRGLLKSLRSLTLSRTGTTSTDNISINDPGNNKISNDRKSLSLNNNSNNQHEAQEQRKVSRNSIHIMQKPKTTPSSSSTSQRPMSQRANRKLSKKKQKQRGRSSSFRSQNAPLSPAQVDDVTAEEPAAPVITAIEVPITPADDVAQLAPLPEEPDPPTLIPALAPIDETDSLCALSLGGPSVDADANTYSERCTMHPGMRNDLWCENCETAICEHCNKPGAHHSGHQVLKLSVAYDDTFESIEQVQLQLMSYLSETRIRSTLLDSTLNMAMASYENTRQLVEQQKQEELEHLDLEYGRMEQRMLELVEECSGWRQHVEESVELAQKMAEEFTPAQAVAQRGLFLRVLAFATHSRPDTWDHGVPEHRDYADLAIPASMVDKLMVPNVMELGRKRGHVRVTGDLFTAHGSVWRMEARRTRNRTGDPMLTVSVSCVERGGSSDVRYTVGVSLASESSTSGVFVQSRSDQWEPASSHDFALCSLDELLQQPASALSDSGSVTVRLSVDIAGYKMLAEAQDDRIRVLEQRIRDLESQQQQQRGRGGSSGESDTGPIGGTPVTTTAASLRPDRRKRSDSRGWATSPRIAHRRQQDFIAGVGSSHVRVKSMVSPMPALPALKSFSASSGVSVSVVASESLASTLMPTTAEHKPDSAHQSPVQVVSNDVDLDGGLCTAEDCNGAAQMDTVSPKQKKPEHRRTSSSLSAKLRRAPPIPFPLNLRAHSVQSQAPSVTGSESQTSLGDSSSVLRRLSGWMRSTEGKMAKRVRQLAGNVRDTGGGGGGLDDWTFLDKSLSPGFPSGSTQSLNVIMDHGSPLSVRDTRPASVNVVTHRPMPPSAPLPPIPVPQLRPSIAEEEDGFAFDGFADIEREQKEVDARTQIRRHTDAISGTRGFEHENQLIARKQSVMQRLDALMLIQNTAENSRDGYSQSTLRRISSELGIVMEGRRRRIEDAREMEMGLANRAMRRADTVSCAHFVDEPLEEGERKPSGRRTVSMDPSEIRRGISRAVANNDDDGALLPPVPALPSASMESITRNAWTRDSVLSRRVSSASATSSSSSIGRSSARITRPCGASRRESLSDHGSKVLNRNVQQNNASATNRSGAIGQLTPQASRRGGILKAGRTKREAPGRIMHGLADVCPLSELSGASNRFTEHADVAVSGDNSPLSKNGRQTRQTWVARKRVRFPEQDKLLKTIWMVDPSIAQSIEDKATTNQTASLSPPTTKSGLAYVDSDDSDCDTHGLAARIRSSPRLSPRRVSSEEYRRPPPLPQSSVHLQKIAHVVEESDDDKLLLVQGRASDAHTLELPLLNTELPVVKSSWRNLYIGPNTVSAQSSPVAVKVSSSNISSPSPGSELEDADRTVFGAGQIPNIARGRNTAFQQAS
ncbi:hypothetical protein FB645_003274 [Coemansia sp. IMI 203386]|nr:hypothetical protein FB645_003274 [Coemansia sp. IMI 203386]